MNVLEEKDYFNGTKFSLKNKNMLKAKAPNDTVASTLPWQLAVIFDRH